MNTNRTAVIGGTAALLLVLTGCAGVDGQFDDGARADSAQQRLSAAEPRLSPDQVAQAVEAYERLREVKDAEFQARNAELAAAQMTHNERLRTVKQSELQGQTAQRSTADFSVNERIRQSKQSESTTSVSVQERIRESKQAESAPAPQPVAPTPMTPEQVRELKGSQVQ